jgi:hypothetical protein
MKRLIALFGFAAVCLLTVRTVPVSAADNLPLVVTECRTIVAFFPPVNDPELQKDADTYEALADFQLYATHVREPLKNEVFHVLALDRRNHGCLRIRK